MVRTPSKEITARQGQILAWVKAFIRDHGMPPTVREIGAGFGIKSSSVFALLKALERKGYVERGTLGARSLSVKGPKRKAVESETVPIIGRIAAGQPIEAIEDNAGGLHVNKGLLGAHGGFALEVVGDSMVEAGILDGDNVIVRRQETAQNGDIVVALVGDEATLKRFYRDRDGIRLEPANRRLKPIRVRSGEFRIQGKVVGVQRLL
jgi:repressor LexA